MRRPRVEESLIRVTMISPRRIAYALKKYSRYARVHKIEVVCKGCWNGVGEGADDLISSSCVREDRIVRSEKVIGSADRHLNRKPVAARGETCRAHSVLIEP